MYCYVAQFDPVECPTGVMIISLLEKNIAHVFESHPTKFLLCVSTIGQKYNFVMLVCIRM